MLLRWPRGSEQGREAQGAPRAGEKESFKHKGNSLDAVLHRVEESVKKRDRGLPSLT